MFLGGGRAAWEDWELSLWSGQGLRESLLGKGDQMEELEQGKGGGPRGWVWDAAGPMGRENSLETVM